MNALGSSGVRGRTGVTGVAGPAGRRANVLQPVANTDCQGPVGKQANYCTSLGPVHTTKLDRRTV